MLSFLWVWFISLSNHCLKTDIQILCRLIGFLVNLEETEQQIMSFGQLSIIIFSPNNYVVDIIFGRRNRCLAGCVYHLERDV